jgi:hypothetical protein
MVVAAKIGKPICHPDLLDGLSSSKHGVIIVPWPAAIHLNSLKIEGRGTKIAHSFCVMYFELFIVSFVCVMHFQLFIISFEREASFE